MRTVILVGCVMLQLITVCPSRHRSSHYQSSRILAGTRDLYSDVSPTSFCPDFLNAEPQISTIESGSIHSTFSPHQRNISGCQKVAFVSLFCFKRHTLNLFIFAFFCWNVLSRRKIFAFGFLLSLHTMAVPNFLFSRKCFPRD